ncbi:MAG: hypothetical protein E7074_03330 [Bacteroidales bacterium]|nr:hypothetical protein [Bacteroidales bacterium]
MVYSFDIFDTCLLRKCGNPRNIFDVLAQRAFTNEVSIDVKRAFVAARVKAESDTWSNTQKISDIYNSFQFAHPTLLPKSDLMSMEIELEKEMLVPSIHMLQIVNTMRQKGNRIMFVSDMYLTENVLRDFLQNTGFYQSGDRIYVSCEVGVTKSSGEMFKYIAEHENVHFNEWHHYGDHSLSDNLVPHELGIHTHRVAHSYTPYQTNMQRIPSLNLQWGSILAGLSRSLRHQNEISSHNDFVLDIIAPLFTSFVCRVLADAHRHNIDTLYFCARDAYPLYRIALVLQKRFPSVQVQYLYISRESLYQGDSEPKLGYFRQCGLASISQQNAILDIRSTGKTLEVINDLLSKNGYNSIRGYFFETMGEPNGALDELVYSEISDAFISGIGFPISVFLGNWDLFELYFPLNTQKRTIGYRLDANNYVPVLERTDVKEYKMDGLEEHVTWRNVAFDCYADYFVQLGLESYATEIFSEYAIPQLLQFMVSPSKHYLPALESFYARRKDGKFYPYVDNSIWRLLKNILRKRVIWKRGTIFYTIPCWLSSFLYNRKDSNRGLGDIRGFM